jgi:hypothetical protein
MDEAYSEELRGAVSAARATDLMNAGTPRIDTYSTVSTTSGVPLRLDSTASTQKAPYFISCAQPACLTRRGCTHDPNNTPAQYHRPNREYVSGDAGGSQKRACNSAAAQP